MVSAKLPGYEGPSVPPRVQRFLEVLVRHGFTAQATVKHAGKTINLEHAGERYGYINGSVLSRGGIVGYRFFGMGHPYNGVPIAKLEKTASDFTRRYQCEMSDLVLQAGGGSNAGKGFLIIANPTVALRVLLTDAGLAFDSSLEITETQHGFIEGLVRDVMMQRLERSTAARRKCLELHGYTCKACGQRLKERYVGLSVEIVHVHHIEPLSSSSGLRNVDPIHDLVPVCPNCHAVIHSREPPYSVEEVRKMCAEHEN